ncbi:F0F1 ATP synthase subunit delta [Marinicauda algicola]|uniref:ATP synthase subunit delta n=1 Tax=Marinicauda algicola TaxID=2029849 RepID=A0A4S2H0S2_9PROT|nr:F0F1 ATP synthase subunit delta [Marinicauda algicola]TGY88831.1 F0F1 ATP synthase subunit delta [Marinicauda algicola]
MTTGENAVTGEAGKRYAKALFELAEEAKALDATETDVTTLGEAFGESADLRRVASSPLFGREDKAKALEALADRLGLSDLVKKFVAVMAANGRAGDLPDAVRAFKAMAARRRGATEAEVTSADKLTAAQLKELQAALKSALGHDVEVRAEVNPELIGGLVVKVGSRMFDSSLRSKLEGMRNAMKEA